jgi:D-alanine-D-alanine ligase
VTKAIEKSDIIPALETAFKEDNEVLIEEFLDGTEVSVGVITYNNEVLVLPITEIVSENDFFDFEAKYQGKSQEITPARLSNEQEGNVKQLAKKVYQSLQLRGLSRAEYIFKNGVPHFIEINTIPGITNESILPQQAAVAGISLEALLTSVVENALNQIN